MHPKALVETAGNFQYQDLSTDSLIRHDRPTVVEISPYVTQLLGRSAVTIVRGNLPEAATDDGFVTSLRACEGDAEMAIDSYLSELDPEAEPDPKSPSTDQKVQSQVKKPTGK